MTQSSAPREGTRPRIPRAKVTGEGAGRGGSDAGPPAPERAGTGGDGSKRRPRSRARSVLRWSALTLSFVMLGAASAGYLYYRHLNDNIKKDDLSLGEHRAAKPTPNAAGQTPLNVLVIGSDSRNTAENLRLGGHRASVGAKPLADVQMLVHLSADRSNISVVSMPRDTMVEFPKCVDPDDDEAYPASTKLMMTNLSLGRGGPGCTVATWERLTGIRIDHFVQVDFAGVVSMADAIGGVPVCVKDNVHSRNYKGEGSGLRLAKGTHAVKGEQALQWLRTRYGFEDGTDLARTHAQHMYMNSMVRELRKNATLTNPNKLRRLAETATEALTVDPGLGSVGELYGLMQEMQKVPTERITMTTMPTEPWSQDRNRVVPKSGDADKLFAMVRDDLSLDGKSSGPTPSAAGTAPVTSSTPTDQITVLVRNGTGADGGTTVPRRATDVVAALRDKGFDRAAVDAEYTPRQTSVVQFPSADLADEARFVAAALGLPPTSVQRSTDVSGVTLVVGADWRSGALYPAVREGDKAPLSARPLSGGDTDACMDIQEGFTW
ncbi:LCP family protein [Streptomyces fumanus]|uniref:LCP family protein n=1 Tax=Streptomyces fumanus TaxID=67302 RepID=UPI0033C39D6F